MNTTAVARTPTLSAGEKQGLTFPALFAAAVSASRSSVAVTDGDRSWTWARWQSDAAAVAKGLQDRGVKPGDLVAARLPNGWEFLTLHVALAQLGAVLMPLHLALGQAEVDALLGLARPVAVVDREEWARIRAEGEGGAPRPVAVTPSMPFVALPSSGTTSTRPKICLHSHDGLLSNASALASTSPLHGSDVVVSASPFSHLFGLHSVHLSLLGRAVVALLPSWDADDFLALAEKASVTALCAVPAQLHDVLSRLGGRSLPALRTVRTSGAPVPARLVEDLRAAVNASVLVTWGMSEIGAGTSTRPDDPDEAASSTVGHPLPGAEVRVRNGELQFRSATTFLGYLADPDLTRACFTDDGWLRTGDLARIDDDGRVEHRGRTGDLINVGGRKVVAREIEDLLAHVGHVAVVGMPDDRLGEYPCLVTDEPRLTLDDAVTTLREAGVADYKLPLELVTVDAMPLTPSGKIRRGKLVELATSRTGTRGQRAATADLLRVVRECASRLLGSTALIDPDRTFRDYGFDSASSVRFRNELAAATGLSLSSGAVFDHPTPAALARHLTAAAAHTPPAGFEQLYRLLCKKDPRAAADLIRAASVSRPVFTAGDPVAGQVIPLASGSGPVVVVCFSSMLPMTTPTKFTEFARAFDGVADVHGVAHPGFAEGQPVPADADALIAAHVAALTPVVGNRPAVLCGYSSGGWIAHLVAERLTSDPPVDLRGVVLLDASWPSPDFIRDKASAALAGSVEREEALGIDEVGLTRLTATGAYLRLLDGWTPCPLEVPVLHVGAETAGATWELPHEAATASGDHLTMLPAAGHVVATWLRRLAGGDAPCSR
ncbi:AMP-binding protein [Lentzea albida]|uniref:Cyclohexanecarboxylate-CoA ligase n=1 Tax=Lentzea albida TaxID=65499 RepID=A0A1H9WR19_9PSEU|nr:AMP-binding protein [Lentzea albida]SES36229.1 cyclohexanecarboxylate-CoA ligase [Lentzea albida]